MIDKGSKILYISHKGELLVWLVMILIIVATCSLTNIYNKKYNDSGYHIYLSDVDGLIVGSPVRMMGIEVGYVTKIKPTNKEMFVKFILTNPEIYIPQGTKVTVEFSGLAGSKSLELYLPDEKSYIDSSVPIISVMPPKRLHDAFGLLNEMFKKLNSIIYSASSFGSKLNTIELDSGSFDSKNLDGFIEYSNKFLDNTEKKTNELRPLWEEGIKHVE